MKAFKKEDVIEVLQELVDDCDINWEDAKEWRSKEIEDMWVYKRDCLLSAITLINAKPEVLVDGWITEHSYKDLIKGEKFAPTVYFRNAYAPIPVRLTKREDS